MKKFSPWMILVLCLSLCAFATFASAQAADQKAPATRTVTGCLQKGVEPNGGFFLVTAEKQGKGGSCTTTARLGSVITSASRLP